VIRGQLPYKAGLPRLNGNGAAATVLPFIVMKDVTVFIHYITSIVGNMTEQFRGPIYKESYARLMTAQHLRRTYAELVNCERLTKNHKLNLRKIYAKLMQNLGKTYVHINAVITQS